MKDECIFYFNAKDIGWEFQKLGLTLGLLVALTWYTL